MTKSLLLIALLIWAGLACSLTADFTQNAAQGSLGAEQTPSQYTKPVLMPLQATKTPYKATKTTIQTDCVILADFLHLRAGPGVTAPVIGYLHKGQHVTPTPFTQAAGLWVEVITPAGTGWVNSNFITCEEGR